MDSETKNCQNCKKDFVIEPDDLGFYEKISVLSPKICPDCRHTKRFKNRGPNKLWHRNCMCDKNNHFHKKEKCAVEFKTSYAPDRPEIIYCEKCYQQEVY